MNSKRENDYLIDFEEIVDELQEDDDDKYSIDADSCRYFGEKPAPLYLTEEQKKQPEPEEETREEFLARVCQKLIDQWKNAPLFHDLSNIDDMEVPQTQEEVFGDYYKPTPPPFDIDEYDEGWSKEEYEEYNEFCQYYD